MDLQGKTVLIVGAGKSGIAAGELLRKKGIAYRLYDGNKELSKEELQKNDIWKDCGIILGELPTEILADTGLAVLSPGVPTDLPVIAAIRVHIIRTSYSYFFFVFEIQNHKESAFFLQILFI